MTEISLKVFSCLLCFYVGCESRHDTDLPFNSVRTRIEHILTNCITALSDLNVCVRTTNTLIRKLRNCDQALEDSFVCVSVLPSTKKTLALTEADDDDISFLPEELFTPETRNALAQFEDASDEEDVIVKRGLGRCIHRCLKGPGGMSFIQCKSMCHR